MNRHEARIMIMAALYNLDINDSPIQDVVAYLKVLLAEDKELENDTANADFFVDSVSRIMYHKPEIDEVIVRNLVNYSLDRLSYVDRAIIRLATFEMMLTDTQPNIVINEAIELTKEYSDIDDGSQARFNNRLLDNIKESIENGRK